MKSYSVTYFPTYDITGFAYSVTGDEWILTNNVIGDGLGHRVIILSQSVGVYPGGTALLTGLDSDGNPQTETIPIPETFDISVGAKYFSTLESAVPSVSTGEMSLGWLDESISPTIPLDGNSNAFPAIAVNTSSANLEGKMQQTFANIYDAYPSTLPWEDIEGLTEIFSSANGEGFPGARAIRLFIVSFSDPGSYFTINVHCPSAPIF